MPNILTRTRVTGRLTDKFRRLDVIIRDKVHQVLQQEKNRVLQESRRLLGVHVSPLGGRVIRSRPGEYPRRETGRLQQSLAVRVNKREMTLSLYARLGIAPHARYLNTKAVNRGGRPFFNPRYQSNLYRDVILPFKRRMRNRLQQILNAH